MEEQRKRLQSTDADDDELKEEQQQKPEHWTGKKTTGTFRFFPLKFARAHCNCHSVPNWPHGTWSGMTRGCKNFPGNAAWDHNRISGPDSPPLGRSSCSDGGSNRTNWRFGSTVRSKSCVEDPNTVGESICVCVCVFVWWEWFFSVLDIFCTKSIKINWPCVCQPSLIVTIAKWIGQVDTVRYTQLRLVFNKTFYVCIKAFYNIFE